MWLCLIIYIIYKASKSNQKTLFKPKPLTIPAVFKGLKEIAMFTGNQVIKYIIFFCIFIYDYLLLLLLLLLYILLLVLLFIYKLIYNK